MNCAGKVFTFIVLFSMVPFLGSLTQAADITSATIDTPKEIGLGIYNVSDQDLSPAVRDCLQRYTLANCLQKQFPQGNTSSDPLSGGWKNFLHSTIGNPEIFKAYSFAAAFGFTYGMTRLDPDQVLFDPNMNATDTQQGDQAVWVLHTLALAPGAYDGIETAPIGQPDLSKSYYGGVFQLGGILRLKKRHPLDKIFTKNFWGTLGEDKEIVEQVLPAYLKVPTDFTGGGLLPGEGMQFEAYMAIEIGIGPTYSLGVTPAVPFLGAGVFGSAGLVATIVRGHFNTKMEVQKDQTLRVLLERINEDSEKLDTQINAGIVAGPFSFVKNILNLEVGVAHTKETLLDMTFDTKYAQASHALKEAYFGRFKEAQDLAASSTYQGVMETAHSTLSEHTTDRSASFLLWSKGSSESRSSIDTQFNHPDPANDEKSDDKTNLDEEDSHSSSKGKTADLQIAIRNDSLPSQPGLGRSLSVKYNFKASKPSQSEVQQFVDIAQIFGQAPITAPEAGKAIEGYFFLDLDVQNLESILTLPDSDIADKLEAASLHMPGASNHMEEIKTFAQALTQALKTEDPSQEDHCLLSSLRGKNFDLYAIGALSLLADQTHSLAIERVTFTSSATDSSGLGIETLEFPAVGSQYVFPSRIEF
jgi:hypothetical protein